MMQHESASTPPRPGFFRPIFSGRRRVSDHHLQSSLSLMTSGSLLMSRAGGSRRPPAIGMLTATGVLTGTLPRSRCRVIAAGPFSRPVLSLGTDEH